MPFSRSVLIAALASLSTTAHAADVRREVPPGGGPTVIHVTGPFEAGDDKALARALLETDGDTVVRLESPGGSLNTGLAMGRAIRLQGATTIVADGDVCASACGLAWLGGTQRQMGSGAQIGFHAAFYVDDQGRKIETGQGNALIGAYLNQLGLSERAVLYITRAAPADMTWLSMDDAETLGISVRRAAYSRPSAPATAPGTPPASQPERPTPTPAVAPPPGDPDPNADWQVVHHAPAGYMNVRAGPGTNHPVLFTVQPSQPVALDSCRGADAGGGNGRWCRIYAAGRPGWISRIGLEPRGTTSVPETMLGNWQVVRDAPAGFMNVRKGPGTAHEILFTVKPGTPIGVSNCQIGDSGTSSGIWCRIVSDGRSGWIARSGLEPETAMPSAANSVPLAPGTGAWRVRPDVSGGQANVRGGPGTMHGILFAIPAGRGDLTVERCRPSDPGGGRHDWCLVLWQGRSGWVSVTGLERTGG